MTDVHHIFLTVLGTGTYHPTTYRFPDGSGHVRTRFSPIASLEFLRTKQISPTQIIVFLTQKARETNWTPRKDTPGMKDELLTRSWGPVLAEREIPDGITEPQLMEIFHHMFSTLKVEVECIQQKYPETKVVIHFDITHGFRHLPMQLMLLLHYAKVLLKVEVQHIFYGAYEAPGEEKPLLNLAFFSDLQDWTRAVGRFTETGDASMLQQMANSSLQKYASSSNLARILLNVVKYAEKLVTSIQTCQGQEIIQNQAGKKLQCLFHQLQGEVNKNLHKDPVVWNIGGRILILLIDKIREAFKEFISPSCQPHELLRVAAEYCLRYGWIQQAYTLLREDLVTRLVVSAGHPWDDWKFRPNADAVIGIIAKNLINQPAQWQLPRGATQQDVKTCLQSPYGNQLCQCQRVISELVQLRNAIDHACMSQNAPASHDLIKRLKKIVDQLP